MKVGEIDDLLARGVETFIDPQGKFKEKLLKNPSDIIIKFGADPTRPDIHLGHAVVLQKLRKFQDLGCKVVFLVGDFTARIGDPTGKSKIRPEIEHQEIISNMGTYLQQVGKILLTDKKHFDWIQNSEWFDAVSDFLPEKEPRLFNGAPVPAESYLGKTLHYIETRRQHGVSGKDYINTISLFNLIFTLRHITHAQLIERDMFQERIKKGQALYLHEMLYPILQGVDSFVLHKMFGACDLEIGGTDQTFNMLMGREVMKINKQPEQAVMSIDILVGLDGKEKMSKSLDNYIGIADKPQNMFGKVMSIPDSAIINYYKLCTKEANSKRISEVEEKLANPNINPRDIKLELAEEITSIYHSAKDAKDARESFLSTFQKKGIPDNILEISVHETISLSEACTQNKITASKSDFRRLIVEGAVKRLSKDGEEEKITDDTLPATPGVYKIGKRRFVKIV